MTNVNTQTQVTVIVNTQTQINQPVVQTTAKATQQTALNTQDTYKPEIKKEPTSPTGILKLVAGGSLLGGGISAVASSVGKAMINDMFEAPGFAGVATGASIGLGVGLLNIESDNKTVKSATKTAGGAFLGLGITGIAQSICKAMVTESVQPPSTSGILLGASLGGGIALANADFGNKDANNIKNTIAGALIGGGVTGLGSALIKTLGSDRLMGYSPVAMGIGMAVGAGIGLLNAKD